MVTLHETKESRVFLTMGANGLGKVSLRQEVEEGIIGAVKRDWTVNDKSGTKYEILHNAIDGIISNIEIRKEETKGFGDQLVITFEKEVSVVINTDSRFGSSILRQLPNVDLTKPLKLMPYSYTPKGKDKEVTGVSLKQGVGFEDKISDFFFDFENKKSLHGIPEATFDFATAEEWETKKFWSDVDNFLQTYTIEKVIPNLVEFVADVAEESKQEVVTGINDDIAPEDIPF